MICIGGGLARGNWVVGQTTNTSAYQAYGANAVLDRCYSFNCRTFLYMDTGDVGPLLVQNCQAWGIAGEFVHLAPAAGFKHHDVTVSNNTAELGRTGTFFEANPGGAGARLYNISVLNNTAMRAFGQSWPVHVMGVRNFHSAGNRWLKTGFPYQRKTPLSSPVSDN